MGYLSKITSQLEKQKAGLTWSLVQTLIEGFCQIHVLEGVLLKKSKIRCKMLQLEYHTPLKYTWLNLRMQ